MISVRSCRPDRCCCFRPGVCLFPRTFVIRTGSERIQLYAEAFRRTTHISSCSHVVAVPRLQGQGTIEGEGEGEGGKVL